MKSPRFTSLLFFIMILAATQVNAQRRTVNVKEFEKISFNTSGNVYVTQGNTTKVEVETSDERWEKLTVEVRGNNLVITQKNGWGLNMNSGSLDVYITTPTIRALDVSGSGKMIVENKIKTGDLDLNVSGSGRIHLATTSGHIECTISGSGNIELSGTSSSVDCRISGSGNLHAEEMVTGVLEASISGSGGCDMEVNEEISARISGSGSIHYKGNPAKVDSHTSGSGRVKKIS